MTPPSAGDKADIYQSGHWTQVARMGEVSRIYLHTVGIQKYSQMYVIPIFNPCFRETKFNLGFE